MQENCVPVLWDDDCHSASIYQEMVRGMKLAALRNQNNVVIYTGVEHILKEQPQARVVIVVGLPVWTETASGGASAPQRRAAVRRRHSSSAI